MQEEREMGERERKKGKRKGTGGLTPGARPDLESCMRTLMVSSGWQHSCRQEKTRSSEQSENLRGEEGGGPALGLGKEEGRTYGFHGAGKAAGHELGREPDGLLVSGARHAVERISMCAVLIGRASCGVGGPGAGDSESD